MTTKPKTFEEELEDKWAEVVDAAIDDSTVYGAASESLGVSPSYAGERFEDGAKWALQSSLVREMAESLESACKDNAWPSKEWTDVLDKYRRTIEGLK